MNIKIDTYFSITLIILISSLIAFIFWLSYELERIDTIVSAPPIKIITIDPQE